MWSIEPYLESLYNGTLKTHDYDYSQEWKTRIINQFKSNLGNFKNNLDSPTPVLLEKENMGNYTRMRVEISTIDTLKMPVYVLVPNNMGRKNLSAVIAVHGHGYGSKEIVGLNPDGSLNQDPGIHKNFAVELVEKGVVVFAPELIGFGDRKLVEDQNGGDPTENSCYRLASQLLLFGKTLPGLRVAECIRLIDYVKTFDGVESGKVGIMGLSGGGLISAFTSILDERIKATVISGYTNTFKGSIMERRHCLDNYVPGILELTEMPELIGLIAPRPLFIEAGKDDHLFPINDVKIAIKKIHEIYEVFQGEDHLAHHLFDGGHEVSGERSFDWLIKHIDN
ncbi:dienelactone hydrolase family protein [Aquibacillus rhizosphaerae]|uniref:Alpha/beta hydrolase family protein n=1 Tax=Aquibacillus rhizosphaerae TaxID=3051431 RepID=A0ABT7L347_9BACI|nr:alpha/beta hydrolase family protein [Aquibacillus sp. LR5S19]MDL4840268.1 alpha/beta hydrolase family protein [Aquibacillus sp. LR5S19]